MSRKKQQEKTPAEAFNSQTQAQSEPEKTSRMTFRNALRYGAAAVGAILIVSALTIIPQINFGKLFSPSGEQTAAVSSADPTTSELISSVPAVQEPSKEPVFHPILWEQWSSKLSYDPELYYEYNWNRSQVLSYLGKGIRPAMPMDLKESDRKSWTVYAKKESGEIAYDFFQFIFAENFDDTYQPDRRKMTIGVSKLGLSGDCLYVMEGQELTKINGIDMKLGFRELEDGCIIMAAYFVTDGLKYEVICENLTYDEFIQILKSIV